MQQSYPASFFLTGIQSNLVLQSIDIPKHSEGNGGRKFASPRKAEVSYYQILGPNIYILFLAESPLGLDNECYILKELKQM